MTWSRVLKYELFEAEELVRVATPHSLSVTAFVFQFQRYTEITELFIT